MDEIKNKVKAIIFDMDGTIVNTEQVWRNVTLDTLKHHGVLELTQEQEDFLSSLSGVGLVNATIAVKEFFNLQHSVEQIAQHKLERANFHLSQAVNFIEGFEKFHEKLQLNSIPTSIATNSSPENLKQIATTMNFEVFFGKNMYCIADVQNKAKPDPAVFLHAAKMLGVSPTECIVFEDSLVGFKAAQAAGMRCIAVKNNLNHHLLDHVNGAIESYHEAEDILKKI